MKLNHIGYVVKNLGATGSAFQKLGYSCEAPVDFPAHKCRVCFLRKDNEIPVELVEPYPENKSLARLATNEAAPYHLCYEVEDIDAECARLADEGYLALSEPLPAPAFGGRKICYLWSRELGYMELLNIK